MADPTGILGRNGLPDQKRIELLEHDRETQSQVLTALVEASKTFTPEQMAQLRGLMIDVLGNAGLRVDAAPEQDEARKDFMFLRWLRTGVNGTATKVGWLVIASLFGGVIWLANAGLNAWKAM